MNFRKLLTYLTVSTAAVIPFAGAQNPTILQGSYISNVFGNSNFVLNPNAQTNVANVTTVTATVTRSTTTPLVATSEFTVAIGTANGTATWATRAFDAGMKGQNCEARFSYRGFAATSKVHIKQGANTVASLNLTPATDPRIASINFPCGDLSNPTTFQVTDTAILAGTNEIGGIYVGLATNMANVAQAEVLVRATVGTSQSIPNNAYTKVAFDTETLDVYNEFNTTTNTFTAKRAGQYFITATYMFSSSAWAPNANILATIVKNGSETMQNWYPVQGSYTNFTGVTVNQTIDLAVGDTIWIGVNQNSGGAKTIFASTTYGGMSISRFPSSSELVVTPERQNWYVSAVVSGGLPNLGNTSVPYSEITNSTLTLYPESGSQPVATLCSGTNAPPTASTSTTTCAAGDESVGITFTPPSVGSYEVCAEFSSSLTTGAGGSADVTFAIGETATNNNLSLTTYSGTANAGFSIPNTTYNNIPVNICQIVQVNSLGQKAYRLFRQTTAGGTITTNVIIANDSQGKRNLRWKVTPVTNQSNSALYVQGPVLGAQTGAAIPSGYLGKSEFGGGTGTVGTSATTGATTYTISNVTPGVYLTRLYGAIQNLAPNTTTFAEWTCTLTDNAALTFNAYDVVNYPQVNIGGGGPNGFGGAYRQHSSNSFTTTVTSTKNYYVRCAIGASGSGITVTAGAELIRLN